MESSQELNRYNVNEWIENWARAKADQVGTAYKRLDWSYEEKLTCEARDNAIVKPQQVKQSIGNISRYDKRDAGKTLKDILKQSYINDSNTQQTSTKEFSTEMSEYTGHSLTKSLHLGANLGVSYLGELGVGFDLDFSSTQEKGNTTTKSIHQLIPVTLEPKTEMEVSLEIYEVVKERDFSVELCLEGEIAIRFADRVAYRDEQLKKLNSLPYHGRDKVVFVPIHKIFKDLSEKGQLPSSLNPRIEGNKVTLTLSGVERLISYEDEVHFGDKVHYGASESQAQRTKQSDYEKETHKTVSEMTPAQYLLKSASIEYMNTKCVNVVFTDCEKAKEFQRALLDVGFGNRGMSGAPRKIKVLSAANKGNQKERYAIDLTLVELGALKESVTERDEPYGHTEESEELEQQSNQEFSDREEAVDSEEEESPSSGSRRQLNFFSHTMVMDEGEGGGSNLNVTAYEAQDADTNIMSGNIIKEKSKMILKDTNITLYGKNRSPRSQEHSVPAKGRAFKK